MDQNETGLGGWTINLYELINGKELKVATTVTDKNGNYSIGNLGAGTYDVYAVSQPNQYKPTGKSLTGYRVKLAAAQNASGFTFSEKPIA